jgi:hypothetical protein
MKLTIAGRPDYLKAGFEINLSVAVDFTGSNGRALRRVFTSLCQSLPVSALLKPCVR